MSKSLEGEIALVTGASRGIGKAIANRLAADGATVIGTATTDKGAEAITAYLQASGGKGMCLNVTDSESVAAVIKQITDEFGPVSILVNNAGIQHVAPIDEFPTEKWDAIIAINMSSAFHTTAAALPFMRKAG